MDVRQISPSKKLREVDGSHANPHHFLVSKFVNAQRDLQSERSEGSAQRDLLSERSEVAFGAPSSRRAGTSIFRVQNVFSRPTFF